MIDSQVRRVGEYISVLAGTVILFIGMRFAAPIVGPLLLVVFFAILCRPIYARLLRWKISGTLAVVILAALLVGTVSLLIWIVVGSLRGLAANIDEYGQMLRTQMEGVTSFLPSWSAGSEAQIPTIGTDALLRHALVIIGVVAGYAMNFFYIVIGVLFLVVDGPKMWATAHAKIGHNNPVLVRLEGFGPEIIRYFGMRTYLNFLTGLGAGIAFFMLGVDYAALWGVLVFLLSYVPYIGLFIAGAPPVVLAFAEYGLVRALIVVAVIVAVNIIVENIAMPRMAGRDFSLSPFVVYASFFFWTWLIGPSGAVLAGFLTLLFTRLLDSFDESRWLAAILAPGNEPDGVT